MPRFSLKSEHRPGEVKDSSARGAWHPSLFREGKIDTLPFEHEYVIAYRGTAREIFFDFDTSSGMRGESGGGFSYRSVLKQGYLNPENTYWSESEYQSKPYSKWRKEWMEKVVAEGISEGEAENIWEKYMDLMSQISDPENAVKEFESYLSSRGLAGERSKLIPEERMNIKKPGVFFGDWEVAKYYSRSERNGVILETRMPKSNLSVIVRPPDRDNPSSVNRDMEFRNERELERKIGKDEFRRLCGRSVREPSNEIVQYVWRSELSLEHVSGVYDPAVSENEVILALSDYVRDLKRQEVLKMKDISFMAEEEAEIDEEINVLRNSENRLRLLLHYLKGIEEGYRQVAETISAVKSEEGDAWLKAMRSDRNSFRTEISRIRRGLLQIEKNLAGDVDPDAEGYSSVLAELVRFLEEETGADIRNRECAKIDELGDIDLGDLIEDTRRNVEKIEDLLKRERKESHELSFDSEDVSREQAFLNRIDRFVVQSVSELPDLSALEKTISTSLESDEPLRALG